VRTTNLDGNQTYTPIAESNAACPVSTRVLFSVEPGQKKAWIGVFEGEERGIDANEKDNDDDENNLEFIGSIIIDELPLMNSDNQIEILVKTEISSTLTLSVGAHVKQIPGKVFKMNFALLPQRYIEDGSKRLNSLEERETRLKANANERNNLEIELYKLKESLSKSLKDVEEALEWVEEEDAEGVKGKEQCMEKRLKILGNVEGLVKEIERMKKDVREQAEQRKEENQNKQNQPSGGTTAWNWNWW